MTEPTQCYLCEQPLPSNPNRDHVIPKQLFDLSNMPTKLYTLPTCPTCNSGMSQDEEYFRVCLLGQSYGQPEATNLWTGPVARSLHRRDGRFRKMLASDISPVAVSVPFYSETGQYIGDSSAMKFSVPRVRRVLEKIVRGLYWKHTETLIGDVPFDIYPFDPAVRHSPEAQLPHLRKVAQTFESGGNVLTYSFAIAEDDPHGSVWWLQFYSKPVFMVVTGVKAENEGAS
jgi:hypothetical protein